MEAIRQNCDPSISELCNHLTDKFHFFTYGWTVLIIGFQEMFAYLDEHPINIHPESWHEIQQ